MLRGWFILAYLFSLCCTHGGYPAADIVQAWHRSKEYRARQEPTDTRDVNLTSVLGPLNLGLIQQCSINQPILTFPASTSLPQALSPQTQECALVAEEYSINWASLLNPHCAPDPVLGLDKRRPFHLVLVGGWALPSY